MTNRLDMWNIYIRIELSKIYHHHTICDNTCNQLQYDIDLGDMTLR